MITANVYHRVIQIRVGDSIGTCFTVDEGQRQYTVTARHVVADWDEQSPVQIFHDNAWRNIDCSLVGQCDGDIDVAVLSLGARLSPNLPLPASSGGIVWGQDVFFLGFPYGWRGDIGELNRNFPVPFVKKAILSGMKSQGEDGARFYLDGHNNKGFSGGPVVFKEQNNQSFKIASVISGFRYTNEPIFDGDQQLPLAYQYNTGIILSFGIEHALELIENNPIGFPIDE